MTMNPSTQRWLALLIGLSLLGGYWLVPIPGQVIITFNEATLGPWPRIERTPPLSQAGQTVRVTITDDEPWADVLLTVEGQAQPLETWQAQPDGRLWQWTWEFPAPETADYQLTFYHDCQHGCQQRGQWQFGPPTEPAATDLLPTKLCVVFPNPDRQWHQRRGWGVELTYAQPTNDSRWQLDALAERVQTLQAQGLRVLVRVDYAPSQSLPPTDNHLALTDYLAYLRRLARDDRLQDVHGYFLGSSYNAASSNALEPDKPVTPAWYARLFNGYGEAVTQTDNAVQIIHAENPHTRVLVGSVQPWNRDSTGTRPYRINQPWLNYMNSLVALLDAGTQAKLKAGIPLSGPDGFALQAPGRPDAPELRDRPRSQEPALSLKRPTWQGAEVGLQVYQDWLAIINAYPTTRGLPVYLTTSNTFTHDEGVPPAQNYPAGWLTNALATINPEPQIQTLCWFMDDIPGDAQWAQFSLTRRVGQLNDAADEFEVLLRGD